MSSTKAKFGFIKGSSNNGSLVGATAINTTGTYNKFYFNTSLSVEEVMNILKQLNYVDYNGLTYGVFVSETKTRGLFVATNRGSETSVHINYSIVYMDIEQSIGDVIFQADLNQDETIFSGSWNITDKQYNFDEFTGIDKLDDIPIGQQNELLKDLISATPFESGEGITPSGTLDITENGTYDVTQYASANVSVEVDIDNISGLQALLDKQKHMYYLFYGFPDDNLNAYASLDTSQVINMTRTFFGSAITEIPPFNFSNVEIFNGTFEQCGKLKTPPSIDFSNAIEVESMFLLSGISGELPQYNFSNVRKMSSFCANTKITKIPVLETSKVIDFMNAFGKCTELEEVLGLNLISSTNNSSMFSNAQKLKVLYVYNIKNSLMIGSNAGENNYNVSWGHLLTLDSLINTIKELINVGSAKTLTMGSTNLEKISNTYVKFTDSTQTTISTNEKGNVIVCESTDTGAMLLKDYAALKNWTLV